MQDSLLFILSIVGILAIYWVLFGEKKHKELFQKK